MELCGPVGRDAPGASRWGHDPVLFDGMEDEIPASPSALVTCPVCSGSVEVWVDGGGDAAALAEVEHLVDAQPELGEHLAVTWHRWDRSRWLRTALGLTVGAELTACPGCASELLVVTGHGEFQPGRYVTTLQGVAPIRWPHR